MSLYDFINDKMANTPNMRELRATLLKDARGRTLEVGFGTGLNVPFYPAQVEHLIAVEPSRGAEKKARLRMAHAKVPMEWTQGSGEKLSFPDASFDTVVTTLVLCTKHGDVRTILSEIKRVLKPGGRYLFLERGLDTRLLRSDACPLESIRIVTSNARLRESVVFWRS